MNFRSRALLNLCYEFDCLLQIEGVCTGGTGEPCHANWQLWGKNGGGEKAPDWAIASGCRACHTAIDQGSKLSAELREHYWMRGHVRTMNALWARELITVRREGLPEKEGAQQATPHSLPPSRRKGSKRGTHCARPEGALPRRYTTR